MMSITSRVKKLEESHGVNATGKLHIIVSLKPDEDANTGLKRYLKEKGIDIERIGYACFFGGIDTMIFEGRDFGGYGNIKSLQGYAKNTALMKQAITDILAGVPSSLGPPKYRKELVSE